MLSLREIIRVTHLYERGNKHKLSRRRIIQNAMSDLEAEQANLFSEESQYRDPNREHSTWSRGLSL